MRNRLLLTAVLFGVSAACIPLCSAQEPTLTKRPDPPSAAQDKTATLNLQAKLVSLPVVVRDKKGNLVKNLTKDDFALWVDNKPQPIRYFDKDDDLPYTLGLLVDTSQSVRNSLDEERTASEAFLDGMLGTRPAAAPTADAAAKPVPDKTLANTPDRAFVIQFARQVELLQDLTDSKPKLKAALRDLDTSSPNFTGSNGGDNNGDNNNGNNRQRGGTALYDAVYLSSHEVLAKEHGRKAIIILSDGDDRGSIKTLAGAIEAAQRTDTIIYAIYFKGQQSNNNNNRGGFPGGGRHGGGFPGGGGYPGGGGGYPGGGGQRGGGGGGGASGVDGKRVLQRMADETGGRLFEVKGKETFATIYSQIAEELRSQYRLGYSPDAANAAEGYHQIAISVPGQKDDRIQTRDGYYTGAQ
jgi:VWFA-related protein